MDGLSDLMQQALIGILSSEKEILHGLTMWVYPDNNRRVIVFDSAYAKKYSR